MNPLQKAAVRRKSFYIAAIVSLLTISIFYRGLEAKTPDGTPYVWIPFGRDNPTATPGAADKLARQTIISQSRRLELRELEEGEPDLTGEAVRLAMTGVRGFVVTYTWLTAIEQQKRNDFHKFEQSIKAVTTLQPHFITPWIFQSWNVAYNVSVEMQSLGDMYFYIARGIDLGAEGERRNRRVPDLRYWIAFYYQNKFGVADQVQTLRCLFQLSCMPPDERNAQNYLNPDGSVRMDEFKRLCEKHPMLVRRLRGSERSDERKESLRMARPDDVVRFLRDNRTVPSRYKTATELLPFDRQFPVLPPQFDQGRDEANPRSSAEDLTEAFSGYRAARAWFKYANVLVPPNPRDPVSNDPMPCDVPRDYDPFVYRMPKMPARILFLQGPPRAQSYQAEMLQKDGWYDTEGWEVDNGIDAVNAWFVETDKNGQRVMPKQPVVIGSGTEWSQAEWQKAYDYWKRHGEQYGLTIDDNRMIRYRAEAGLAPGQDQVGYPRDATDDQMADPAFARRHNALAAIFYYQVNRVMTNFPYYLESANAEQQKETVQARKTLWKANQARREGDSIRAAKLYQQGLEQWRGVLARNRLFHRSERLNATEDQTCEFELEYLRLIARDDPLNVVRKQALLDYQADYRTTAQAAAAVIPFGIPDRAPAKIPDTVKNKWLSDTAEKHFAPFAGTITAQDVPAGDPRIGTPWIRAEVRESVLQQQGILNKPVAPARTPQDSGSTGSQ